MATTPRPSNRAGVTSWNISSKDDPSALDFYQSGIADWYEVSRLARGPFFTENTVCQFGPYVLGRGRSVGQTLTRGPAEIRRSGMDGVSILLDFAGLKGDVDGMNVSARPGTIHFRDLARPSAARVAAVDAVVLAMPREAAPAWLLERPFHGASIDGARPLGRLLIDYLSSLGEAAPRMGSDDGIAAIEAALALAERAVGHSGGQPCHAVYGSLRTEAIRLIDRGLGDPALSIERLTAELGVSRTTLFRAFAATGGIHHYIKQRRLQKVRTALLRRVGHRPTIAEIAHEHGFVSGPHFSRSFRDFFGEAPGALVANDVAPVLRGARLDHAMRYDLVLGWMRGGFASRPASSTA